MATDVVAPQVRQEPHAPVTQVRKEPDAAAGPEPRPPFLRRAEVWLVLVVVSGLAVRLYRLDERTIWFDETSSWRTSGFPLGELFEHVAADNNPPLYFLCLKVWSALFGDSLWAMRGLSVLFAGVLMVGTYLFVRALYEAGRGSGSERGRRGRWVAVFATALVATNAFQIRMSWEARMYMLGAALAVLSSWLLVVAWQRRVLLRLWLFYGLSALFLAYTHYYALFTIFAQFLFLAVAFAAEHRGGLRALAADPRARGAGLSLLVVTLGWLPWLPAFLAQRRQVDEQWWSGAIQIESLLSLSHTMLVGDGGEGWLAITAACAIVAIAAILLWRGTLFENCLAMLIVCPVMIAVGYSLAFRNIIVDRYFVFTQVFMLCGAAAIVGRIQDLVIRNGVAILLVFWSATAYHDMWTRFDIANRPGAQGAARFIRERSSPGAPVIVSSPLIYYPALYHLGPGIDCWMVRGEKLLHFEGGAMTVRSDFIEPVELERLKTSTAWVVTGGWRDRPLEIPAHWSLIRFDTFREVFGFQGSITVHEYKIDSNQ